jgi:gliding motility-associated lipoprotein GldD
MYKIITVFIVLITICFVSCKEEKVFIPKPRIYPKVEFPERKIIKFNKDFCAFSFDYPDYMSFEQDTVFLMRNAPHACWFNLNLPSLNGSVHFTYTDLRKCDSISACLHKVYNDAYKMAQEHIPKANALEDFIINNPDKNVYGVLFNIEGHVASPFQIVMTDSVNHAVRAALYFKSRPEADSMAPIIEFVKTDIMNMLNTFEWRGSQSK